MVLLRLWSTGFRFNSLGFTWWYVVDHTALHSWCNVVGMILWVAVVCLRNQVLVKSVLVHKRSNSCEQVVVYLRVW